MVRVSNLKDQIGSAYPRPILYCARCGGEYSANKGDYFMARPDTILKCCKYPMSLVVKRTIYKEAK